MKLLRPTLVVTSLLLLLCCGVYPAVVTVLARVLFPFQAEGSLLAGRGSALVGQTFADPGRWPGYFWGRPSAASPDPATSVLVSGGSNQGPSQAALAEEVAARVALLRRSGIDGPLPVDLVTKSGSGLDPHLSPAAVAVQVPRVARARGMTEGEVLGLVAQWTEPSTLGVLGEPRVNVLQLNLALDARKPLPPAP